jgi:predicted component of type VI protein secretion system
LILDLLTRERISRRVLAQPCEVGAIFFEDSLIALKLPGIAVERRPVQPRIYLGADLPE